MGNHATLHESGDARGSERYCSRQLASPRNLTRRSNPPRSTALTPRPGARPRIRRSLARSGGDRRSRLSTNSQRPCTIALRRLCRSRRDLAEIGLVRCLPTERLMRAPPVIPVEKFGKAALLLDAVGCRAQIDPFVLHGPPQALDENIIVAATAPVHADRDAVIPQHRRELLAGELRALVGIEDAGLAAPGEGFPERLDAEH